MLAGWTKRGKNFCHSGLEPAGPEDQHHRGPWVSGLQASAVRGASAVRPIATRLELAAGRSEGVSTRRPGHRARPAVFTRCAMTGSYLDYSGRNDLESEVVQSSRVIVEDHAGHLVCIAVAAKSFADQVLEDPRQHRLIASSGDPQCFRAGSVGT